MKNTSTLIGAANELPATNDSDWLLLVEYGDYAHPKGMQRVRPETGQRLVRDFHSLRQRLARKFLGCPIYIGHPDDPDFFHTPGHNDTRAYAWVQDMKADERGVHILPKWSEEGRKLLTNAHYRFLSPRWVMQRGRVRTGSYEPARLVSIGLTNQPNIPSPAIANARIEKVDTAHCQALLSNAVRTGRLSPVDLPAWMEGLEADPAGAQRELQALSNAAPRLHTASSLPALAERNRRSNCPRPFLEVVRERMQANSEDFQTAWRRARHTHGDADFTLIP